MPSYLGHEAVYRRLEAEGASCWDRTEYDAFYLKPFLAAALDRLALAPGVRALELGCGTGPATCFLASRGFDVVGVDVSETAIRMAAKHAASRGVTATFRVADACALSGEAEYGVILDGHCLHCVVYDDERRAMLDGAYRLLEPGGVFLVDTMLHSPTMNFGERFILDDAGVLWVKVPRDHELGAVEVAGTWCVPNRRLKTQAAICDELVLAGFVCEWQAEERQAPPDPSNLQLIARKPLPVR